MKRRQFVKLSGIGTGALISGLYGCELNGYDPDIESEVNPLYGDFTNKVISSDIERPAGISLFGGDTESVLKNLSKSFEEILFCGGPIVDPDQTEFLVPPKVFNYQNDFETIEVLYEFGNEDIGLFRVTNLEGLLDEDGGPLHIDGKIFYRPVGVNLDTVITSDSKVLFSTTMSNKILDLTGGVRSVHIEDDELIGISNMIQGKDGKTYICQVAIRNESGGIIRPKRILSLDSEKKITVEFELPAGKDTQYAEFIEAEMNSLYYGGYLEIGTQLRLIENSGNEIDSSVLYVMDQYNKAIYKCNSPGNLENILENLGPELFPSGIAAQSKGNIYYITPPIMYAKGHPLAYTNELAYKPQLRMIKPNGKDEEVLYSFGEGMEHEYQSERITYSIEIDGLNYLMPGDFLITFGAIEEDKVISIYYTNNITGEVGELGADILG